MAKTKAARKAEANGNGSPEYGPIPAGLVITEPPADDSQMAWEDDDRTPDCVALHAKMALERVFARHDVTHILFQALPLPGGRVRVSIDLVGPGESPPDIADEVADALHGAAEQARQSLRP